LVEPFPRALIQLLRGPGAHLLAQVRGASARLFAMRAPGVRGMAMISRLFIMELCF